MIGCLLLDTSIDVSMSKHTTVHNSVSPITTPGLIGMCALKYVQRVVSAVSLYTASTTSIIAGTVSVLIIIIIGLSTVVCLLLKLHRHKKFDLGNDWFMSFTMITAIIIFLNIDVVHQKESENRLVCNSYSIADYVLLHFVVILTGMSSTGQLLQ